MAVKTEQGWSRDKVLSSKDGKAHLYLGRESKCPLISLKKLEPRFAEEKWFAMKINPSQRKMQIVRESQIQEKLEKLMPNMMIIEMKRKSEGISWVAEVSVETEEIPGPMVPKNVKLVDLLSLL